MQVLQGWVMSRACEEFRRHPSQDIACRVLKSAETLCRPLRLHRSHFQTLGCPNSSSSNLQACSEYLQHPKGVELDFERLQAEVLVVAGRVRHRLRSEQVVSGAEVVAEAPAARDSEQEEEFACTSEQNPQSAFAFPLQAVAAGIECHVEKLRSRAAAMRKSVRSSIMQLAM